MATDGAPDNSRTWQNARTAQRVRVCYEMLLAGFTAHEIHAKVSEACRKHKAGEALAKDEERLLWMRKDGTRSIGERMVRHHCGQARVKLEQVLQLKREQALGSSLSRHETIYRLAIERKRLSIALRAQLSIDKLNALDPFLGTGGDGDGVEVKQGIKMPGGFVIDL